MPPYSPTPNRKRRGSALPTPPRSAKKQRTRGGRGNGIAALVRSIATQTGPGAAAAAAYDTVRAVGNLIKGSKKSMPRAKGQSYRSGGRIKKPKGNKGSKFDTIANKGFVTNLQCGAVMTTTRPVGYLAQSTLPRDTTFTTMLKALCKRLLQHAGLRIKNEEEPILDGQYYNSTIELRYKLRDGTLVLSKDFIVTTASTLVTLAADMDTWFAANNGELLPNQFLTLRYYVEFGTLATARMIQSEMDLTAVTVHLHGESVLKMQNRTINSTGNNDDSDVDNVPLDGKFYEFNSNGTVYRDYGQPAVDGKSAVVTARQFGILPTTLASDVGTKMYADIPLKSQFIGCKKNGNWSIEPATIKTSTIKSDVTMAFSKFVNLLCLRKAYNVQFAQFWIGQTRLFAMEKKIFAAAADAVSQISVAFDHELRIGCYISEKKSTQTAPSVTNVPGVTV
ncbi:capsid protein [Sewage-associated circular DNA virus-32]|uniref:Capsid protein n=1 Tax=Sewage-associated circular DNA virus-32 TaxID=1592099 RepID=A0A0B4UH94_9VIRU|nr:capsid protein [Sewage-associated circular DNA virus-32]AJD07559.1 capsid protein [Sewage-associated circular DNA virus-32]